MMKTSHSLDRLVKEHPFLAHLPEEFAIFWRITQSFGVLLPNNIFLRKPARPIIFILLSPAA